MELVKTGFSSVISRDGTNPVTAALTSLRDRLSLYPRFRAWVRALGIAFILAYTGGFLFTKTIKRVVLSFKRKLAISNPKDLLGLMYADVYFPSSVGTMLHGWFVHAPDASDEVRGCVVLTPGWSLTAEYLLPLVPHIQAALGYHCLLIEPRYHGLSEGDKEGTMNVWKIGEDIRSAVRYAASRSDVDETKIGLVGFSAGGGSSVRAAHEEPFVKFLVTVSGFSRFDKMMVHGNKQKGIPPLFTKMILWYMGLNAGVTNQHVSPFYLLHHMRKDMPIFMAHGRDDNIVPFSAFEELKETLRKIGHTSWHGVEVPGARHMNVISKPEFLEGFNQFLTEVVHPMLESGEKC